MISFRTNNRIRLSVLLAVAVLLLTACQKANDTGTENADLRAAENKSTSSLDPVSEQSENSLRISEAMPSNKDCVFDEDGQSSDWVELANLGEKPLSLQDYWISNRGDEPFLWQLPDIQLDAGDRIFLFCSGKDRAEGEFHTNFTLSKNGGKIIISSTSGMLLDEVEYPQMEKDKSICYLSGDELSIENGRITRMPTPGFPNSDKGYEDYLTSSDHHGALVIQEAVSYNDTFHEKPGKFYDWIELKNISDETIVLSEYYLSDQSDNLKKTHLPDAQLKPGELFLVFCSGNSALTSADYFHADFAIGTEEHLYVSDSAGVISDRLFLHDVPLYGSIGRLDDCSGFWYFSNPTPGKDNRNGFRNISDQPSASIAEGVYQGMEGLEIVLSGNGDIYYTLDGSVPDSTDRKYEEPINVKKTTIIRAVCMEENKLSSAPATFSYILNENDTLPVTSLVCEPKEMFGYGGVYSAPRLLDAKCDAQVSFFDTNDDGFTAACSAELHGAHSRTAFHKKSFELKFASRYGGDVEYDLFGDGIRTRFSSLLLRGGSSANLDTVRDCFASKLMVKYCPWLYPQNLRYTAVYINGEYYGIYAWREAYSEQYFADHTGMSEEGITMARGPVSGGELFQLLNDIGKRSISSDTDYQKVAERLDLTSLAGWMAIQSYFDNQDINGNIRYVKLSDGGKWQLIAYDLDYSCLDTTTGWDTVLATYQLGSVCRSLLANQNFRKLLLDTCAELYHSGFTTAEILASYDEMLEPLDDDSVQKDCRRWGDDFGKWLKYEKAMRDHLSDPRMADWLAGLKSLTKASVEEMHEYFPEYY